MRRTYSQIDLDERRKIERWRQAGVEARMPSLDDLPRDRAEQVRGSGDARSDRLLLRYRKLVRHPQLQAAIIERIKHGWSPEQIAGRLACERSSVRAMRGVAMADGSARN